MEAEASDVLAGIEVEEQGLGGEGAGGGGSAGAGGQEEVSIGDNSLTSCEDDVLSTTTGDAEDIVKLEQLRRQPSSSAITVHSSQCAPGRSHHILPSGLPSSLQLCKVHTHYLARTLLAFGDLRRQLGLSGKCTAPSSPRL